MDYHVTFEDGSEGYLSHYGVKGMKWGKWNAETAARYGQKGAGLAGGGGGMLEDDEEDKDGEEKKSNATMIIDDLIGKARQKLDELPHVDNPLYKLKEKTEHYEKTGESDAARQRLKDRYSNAAVLGKKEPKKATADQKRRMEYQKESSLNKAEFHGDAEGYRRAQKHTDNFYGKNGKRAQATEAQRRRRSSDKQEAAMRKAGWKRGEDGVWR